MATERKAVLRPDTYEWDDGGPLSPEEVLAMVGGIMRSQGIEACRIVSAANSSTTNSTNATTYCGVRGVIGRGNIRGDWRRSRLHRRKGNHVQDANVIIQCNEFICWECARKN